MHLFVMFLKKKTSLAWLVSLALTALYLNAVEPKVSSPITIIGFFSVLFSSIFLTVWVAMSKVKDRSRKAIWSGAMAMYLAYLLAISSLNSAGFFQYALASIVLMIGLFISERSFTR